MRLFEKLDAFRKLTDQYVKSGALRDLTGVEGESRCVVISRLELWK